MDQKYCFNIININYIKRILLKMIVMYSFNIINIKKIQFHPGNNKWLIYNFILIQPN